VGGAGGEVRYSSRMIVRGSTASAQRAGRTLATATMASSTSGQASQVQAAGG
jgi:hypothetical protein